MQRITVHRVTWRDTQGRSQTDYRGHAYSDAPGGTSSIFVASTVVNREVRDHVRWAHGDEIDHRNDGGVYRSAFGRRVRYVFMRARRDGADVEPLFEEWRSYQTYLITRDCRWQS